MYKFLYTIFSPYSYKMEFSQFIDIIKSEWHKYDILIKHIASLDNTIFKDSDSRSKASNLSKYEKSRILEEQKLKLVDAFVFNLLTNESVREILSKAVLNATQFVIDDCRNDGKLTNKDILQLRAYYLFLLFLMPNEYKPVVNNSLKQYCLRGTSRVYENYIALKTATNHLITKSVNIIFDTFYNIFLKNNNNNITN